MYASYIISISRLYKYKLNIKNQTKIDYDVVVCTFNNSTQWKKTGRFLCVWSQRSLYKMSSRVAKSIELDYVSKMGRYTPARAAGRLIEDLHLSFSHSKTNIPVSSTVLQQNICCSCTLLHPSLFRGSNKSLNLSSPPPCFSPVPYSRRHFMGTHRPYWAEEKAD